LGKNLKYAIIGIIAVVVILAGFFYFQITGSTTVVAFLNVEEGSVQVNQGKGWVSATDEMNLGLNDRVKTLDDGYASVVLFESTIISLEPATEVLIQNLEKAEQRIRQEAGSTWNKFTGLAGVEGLSVETPTTVATVRGTSFGVTMDAVYVGEGDVEVDMEGEKMMVHAEEKVVMEEEMVDGKMKRRAVKKAFSEADRERIMPKMQRSIRVMKKIREMEIKKKEFVAKRLQSQYGVTDNEVTEHLEKADRGEYDLKEVERKAPVKMEAVRKVRMITEEIVDENKAIERLLQKRPAIKPLGEKIETRVQPEKVPEPRPDIAPTTRDIAKP
jgi:hypothetical protein